MDRVDVVVSGWRKVARLNSAMPEDESEGERRLTGAEANYGSESYNTSRACFVVNPQESSKQIYFTDEDKLYTSSATRVLFEYLFPLFAAISSCSQSCSRSGTNSKHGANSCMLCSLS
ncbi:hypothetical protein Droror1_Dr00014953 [Drosera rotundifolia]